MLPFPRELAVLEACRAGPVGASCSSSPPARGETISATVAGTLAAFHMACGMPGGLTRQALGPASSTRSPLRAPAVPESTSENSSSWECENSSSWE